MARAIVLADTLRDQLMGGLDIRLAAAALGAVDELPQGTIDEVTARILQEDLPEPMAVAAAFEPERDWHFLTVVDIGAGTSDVATFLLTKHPNWERGRIYLVPNSQGSISAAGDEIDQLLFAELRARFARVVPEAKMRIVDTRLQETIRSKKEALFRDGQVLVNMEGATVSVEVNAFTRLPGVLRFSGRLAGMVQAAFSDVPYLYRTKIVEKGGVRMLLTGGGARLPMARELRVRTYSSKDSTIRVRPTDVAPGWLRDMTPEFAEVYPQLAVAVGGASPDLPDLQERRRAVPVFHY